MLTGSTVTDAPLIYFVGGRGALTQQTRHLLFTILALTARLLAAQSRQGTSEAHTTLIEKTCLALPKCIGEIRRRRATKKGTGSVNSCASQIPVLVFTSRPERRNSASSKCDYRVPMRLAESRKNVVIKLYPSTVSECDDSDAIQRG